eukprot:TRINITY_DN102_c0_g1_i1.p1 TRINITY_DN102_c0_g1~~TRINITY_DN102_c0_g1_i1.p1  ORF type:complete len:125 (+),score=33.44 TRINITY_DN102_c0_g1_i1:169-543(+)
MDKAARQVMALQRMASFATIVKNKGGKKQRVTVDKESLPTKEDEIEMSLGDGQDKLVFRKGKWYTAGTSEASRSLPSSSDVRVEELQRTIEQLSAENRALKFREHLLINMLTVERLDKQVENAH